MYILFTCKWGILLQVLSRPLYVAIQYSLSNCLPPACMSGPSWLTSGQQSRYRSSEATLWGWNSAGLVGSGPSYWHQAANVFELFTFCPRCISEKIEHKTHIPSMAPGRIWGAWMAIVTLGELPKVRRWPVDAYATWSWAHTESRPHLQRSSSCLWPDCDTLTLHSVLYSLHRQRLLPGNPASQLDTQPCEHDKGYQVGPHRTKQTQRNSQCWSWQVAS